MMSRCASRWLLLVAVAGCMKEPPTEKPPTPDDPSPTGTTDSGPPIDTADTDTDSGTGDTALVFDCSTIPMTPVSIRPVPNARGYHDVAFDGDYLVGSDNNAMLKVDYYGEFQIVHPNLGVVQQFDWLPSGELVVAVDADNSLKKLGMDGSLSMLTPDLNAYGVIVGPDGMVYAADQNDIYRVDPATGQREILVPGRGNSPKVLAFNNGYTKLYFGEVGNEIHWVDLDANLDPISGPKLLVNGVGSWHDGLGVDVCGNIYVADFFSSTLYRITEDGSKVQPIVTPGDSDFYGHGLRWGNGQGGWSSTALYQPQPYNDESVVEIEIGVPMANSFPGEVVGTVPF